MGFYRKWRIAPEKRWGFIGNGELPLINDGFCRAVGTEWGVFLHKRDDSSIESDDSSMELDDFCDSGGWRLTAPGHWAPLHGIRRESVRGFRPFHQRYGRLPARPQGCAAGNAEMIPLKNDDFSLLTKVDFIIQMNRRNRRPGSRGSCVSLLKMMIVYYN